MQSRDQDVSVEKSWSPGQQQEQEVSAANGGDDDMTDTSHDLSSSNRSPGSMTGSTSTSTKSDPGLGQAQSEVMNTVAQMKKRLPSEKRSRNKPSTVEALTYALNCVKQVQANSEYYKLLVRSGQDDRRRETVCTMEELERVTSEHTMKNTDSFVVVFSLASCRILYASPQASSVLCCKRKFLESAKFVELLFHQDVNVFYSHTAQPHLPPWSNSHTAGVLFECAQVKSFFCRMRGGKDHEGEMYYHPFRITPYLLKVQGGGEEGGESCCLALAERITSGYEAPRIPMDKRIFTTTHSPGCVFLEVDDRAVPLLGYLPQDLIGTSLLTCVHPEDRPLVLSMHRKVLKYAGQPPFEHSPVRLRCQNGDFVTLDTSWSSFINPWSRKVAFIIGRHKVRTSPRNEDVFAARPTDDQISYDEIKELQAKIYKLFLQPVHTHGSSGYGSLGSNSHEHYISVASSSDSNGNMWEDCQRKPMTLQQLCADVNRVKSWGQKPYFHSSHRTPVLGRPAKLAPSTSAPDVRDPDDGRKQPHLPSYQQIHCVDNIIRYLESCSGSAMKRKKESLGSSSSSTSEDDKPTADTVTASSDVVLDSVGLDSVGLDSVGLDSVGLDSVGLDSVGLDSVASVSPSAAAVVGAHLTDLTISTKAMSVVSVTSQCSYSSTIVHVPRPESEATALEDALMGSEPIEPACPSLTTAAEEHRFVGLTKEVLSAHTQKEEQKYVDRFKHRITQSPYSSYLQLDNSSMVHSHHPGDYLRPISAGMNCCRRGKLRHKRPKPQGSSDSYASPLGPLRRVPVSSWPSSESSQPPIFSLMSQEAPVSMEQNVQQVTSLPPQDSYPPNQMKRNYNFSVMSPNVPMQMDAIPNILPHFKNLQPLPPAPAINPYVAPVIAVILPNFPSFNPGFPAQYPVLSQPVPMVGPQLRPQPLSMVGPQPVSMLGPQPVPMLGPQPLSMARPQPVPAVGPQPLSMAGPQLGPQGFTPAPMPFSQTPLFHTLQNQTLPQVLCSPHPGSSVGEEEAAGPRALFSSSRSSSPLQLNLLQEELPKPNDGLSANQLSSNQLSSNQLSSNQLSSNQLSSHQLSKSHHEQHNSQDDLPSDSVNHDAQSTSSELLDLLLQEDARSGTGSNASGSGFLGSASGSNGTSTSHTGSSNSSKYFAGNDSSDTSRKVRKNKDAALEPLPPEENSLWNMIQPMPEHVLMGYQVHTRDQGEVLAEDREKLRVLQPLQPWFSSEQREELIQVHPWIQQQTIPPEIDTQGCVGCSSSSAPGPPISPVSLHTLDSSSVLDTSSQTPLLQDSSVDT